MSSGWFVVAGDSSANQITHVAATLCFFDYFLTLDGEVAHIWRKRVSGATILFVVNRYAMLVAAAANLAQSVPWSEAFVQSLSFYNSTICEHLIRTADICVLLVTVSYISFAALRMCALYGMSRIVFAVVFVVGFISPALQIYPMVVEYIVPDAPSISPGVPLCLKQADDDQFTIISPSLIGIRASTLALEPLLLGLTWNKTFAQWRTLKTITPTSLTGVLLRDGTIYFGVITVVSALNLGGMIYLLQPSSPIYAETSFTIFNITITLFDMVTLVDTITSICMSRFIIGLCAADSGTQYTTSSWGSGGDRGKEETLRFARVVGSLGGELAEDDGFGEEDGDGLDDAAGAEENNVGYERV